MGECRVQHVDELVGGHGGEVDVFDVHLCERSRGSFWEGAEAPIPWTVGYAWTAPLTRWASEPISVE